jgi:uncharacterized repeat protein (TIGR03803 family)
MTSPRKTGTVPAGHVITGGGGSHVTTSRKTGTVPAGHVIVTGGAHGRDPHRPSAGWDGCAGIAGLGLGVGVTATGAGATTGSAAGGLGDGTGAGTEVTGAGAGAPGAVGVAAGGGGTIGFSGRTATTGAVTDPVYTPSSTLRTLSVAGADGLNGLVAHAEQMTTNHGRYLIHEPSFLEDANASIRTSCRQPSRETAFVTSLIGEARRGSVSADPFQWTVDRNLDQPNIRHSGCFNSGRVQAGSRRTRRLVSILTKSRLRRSLAGVAIWQHAVGREPHPVPRRFAWCLNVPLAWGKESMPIFIRATLGVAMGVLVFPGVAGAQFHLDVLHAFSAFTIGDTDGMAPQASLLQAADGDFYGTTLAGGVGAACPGNCGTVFKMTAGGAVTVLHAFTGGAGGNSPGAALIQVTDGNFYGTTFGGGVSNHGTVFRVTRSGTAAVLHAFANADGALPVSSLLQARDGHFYGTTSAGGASGTGVVFRSSDGGLTYGSWGAGSSSGLGDIPVPSIPWCTDRPLASGSF